MNREERLNLLYSKFDECVKEFCNKTEGNSFNIFSDFKGEEKSENLKHRYGEIFYNSFYIKFKYTAHTILSVSHSILEVLVYMDKTQYAIPIPLPLFLDYCDITPKKLLVIPFISNNDTMEQAFEHIYSAFKESLTTILEIFCNSYKKDRVVNSYIKEMSGIFDVECNYDTPADVFEGFSDYFTTKFTVEAFINILKGNKEKAIKQLSKDKILTGYEKRVIEFLKSEDRIDLSDISLIVDNVKNSGNKADLKEMCAVFIPSIVMSIGLSAVYSLIYYILILIEGSNSVYLMGPIYGFPNCFLCAFITALALSYFTRFKFYKLLFKKNYEQYCEIDHITNGGGSDKFMKIFLWIIIVISLVFLLLTSKWNINFTQNGIIDNSDFFSISGEAYSYSDVKKVYYKSSRVNALGEKLEFPSYVMILNNGKEIDFYEFDEIESYEKELLELLKKKGVSIDK